MIERKYYRDIDLYWYTIPLLIAKKSLKFLKIASLILLKKSDYASNVVHLL